MFSGFLFEVNFKFTPVEMWVMVGIAKIIMPADFTV
jgi:hypothetical protein